KTYFVTFFAEAPAINPNRFLITGVICDHQVEENEDPFMRDIRSLDNMVDEVIKGKEMEKVLRTVEGQADQRTLSSIQPVSSDDLRICSRADLSRTQIGTIRVFPAATVLK